MGREATDPFPMVPLAKGQGLGIAIMSYNGKMNFGLVGDFDVMHDIDDLAHDLYESLAELADAAGVELATRGARAARVRILVGVRDKVIERARRLGLERGRQAAGRVDRHRAGGRGRGGLRRRPDRQVAGVRRRRRPGAVHRLGRPPGGHRPAGGRARRGRGPAGHARTRSAPPPASRWAASPPFGHDLPVVLDEALLRTSASGRPAATRTACSRSTAARLVECTSRHGGGRGRRRPERPWATGREPLRAALAQMNPVVGDIAGNAGGSPSSSAAARDEEPQLVVFPELALTGYPPEDLLLKTHFLDATGGGARGAGGRHAAGSWRWWASPSAPTTSTTPPRCWPTARWPGVYRKMHLPNYGVFDEQRYFQAGDRPATVRARTASRSGSRSARTSGSRGRRPPPRRWPARR